MRHVPGMIWLLACLSSFAVMGCGLFSSGVEETGDLLENQDIGMQCGGNDDCREGLDCVDGKCQPSGSTAVNGDCQVTAECAADLYCNNERKCAPAGDGRLGAACETTADCQQGLICTISGFSLVCSETGDLQPGEECEATNHCFAGLICAKDPLDQSGSDATPECIGTVPSPVDLVIPTWNGVSCGEDNERPTAYFDVPRSGGEETDFYRLPFPNDIRRTGSGLDLSGHPAPDVLGLTLIDSYLRASEQDLTGFATNPVVIFRFSEELNFGSVKESSVHVVDISPDSPTYDREHARRWRFSSGKSRYVCKNALAVGPNEKKPLRPNTTYAVYLTREITPDAGGVYARAADFEAMLGDSAPSDSALAAAHAAYAPFRAWLSDSGTDPGMLLNAAVFTTQDPEAIIPALRSAVHNAAMPAVSQLVRCGGAGDPCPSECAGESGYTELHGLISLPVFQQGTPPYEEVGGGIELDGAGVPQSAGTAEVCFALAVPDGEPPAAGFPLVIYGHGTGGGFGSVISTGIARDLANGTVDGASFRAAALGIDMPQHGTRSGDSDRAPEELFFNFLNPRAARDNITQGAADLMALVRWARSYLLPAGSSPVGRTISFDVDNIALFGHSQGALHAALMLPYEPDLSAAVLSGNGAYLTESLLSKTQPFDIAGALPYALLDANSEGKLDGGVFHPVLAIFQMFFERADGINFAYRLIDEPPAEVPAGHHVFMTYGLFDEYSPESTQRAYARAANLPVVGDDPANLGLTRVQAPMSENVELDGVARTVGLRQYTPAAGEEGHFVAFDSTKGRPDVNRFLLQALSGQSPQIGQ